MLTRFWVKSAVKWKRPSVIPKQTSTSCLYRNLSLIKVYIIKTNCLPLGYRVPGNADNLEIFVHESEQNNVNQNQTPLKPSSSLLNLSQDSLTLVNCDIENYIFDNIELSLSSLILSLNESQNQNLEKKHRLNFYTKHPYTKNTTKHNQKI